MADGSSVESLKYMALVCPNCKVPKRRCLSGQEVRYIRSEQVGCKVMAQGPFWSSKDQGKVATVIEASDLDAVTVRWEEKRQGGNCLKAGTVVKYKLFSKQYGGVLNEQGKLVFAFACM